MRPATSENREEYFIIDDTPFRKSGKKTELVSKFFNHVTIKYELGYRILTLLWTDGYSNVPVDFAPLSSGNGKLVVSKAREYDGRTLAGRIRRQACMKAPDLILMMPSQAINAGHRAKYVLFDSWFATPKGIMDIRRYGYRWNIEVYFKTCKQYLKYCKECQSTSFDSLAAHLAVANVRYMMLSVFQRANTDHRSLGELFYMYVQEVAEITFDHSMQPIMIALLTTVKEFFALTKKQMAEFVRQFIGNLPAYLRTPLEACAEQLSAA